MGVSTDAIFVCGVDFGEDPSSFPWYDEEDGTDIEEWWYAEHGFSTDHLWAQWEAYFSGKPRMSYEAQKAEFEPLHPEWRTELDEIYEKRRGILGDLPVDLVRHCSYDYPMYIIAVPDTKKLASRGETVMIDDLYVPTAKIEAAQDFLSKYGIDFHPKWLLCSLWG